MKNKNINTELPLFESDNYKRNFPEDFEWGIYSELSSTKVEEIKSVPEESVPNGKSEANLRKKENTRKRGRFPVYRKMSEIELNTVKYSLN
jgi:hypothetical protein